MIYVFENQTGRVLYGQTLNSHGVKNALHSLELQPMTNKYFMLYSNFFTMKMILLTNLQCKSNNSYHRTVCSEKGKNSVSYLASAHSKQARSAFETKQTKFTG